MGSLRETCKDPFILFFGDFCRQSIKLYGFAQPLIILGTVVLRKEDDNGKGYFCKISRRLSPPPLKKTFAILSLSSIRRGSNNSSNNDNNNG